MNRRQIPFLYPRPLAGGRTAWDWKPSPRLARLGWTARLLGNDEHDAIRAALDLNRQLAEWEAARQTTAPPAPPRQRTVAHVIGDYRKSPEYAALRPATVREYEVRLRFIEQWALDGRLILGQLDGQMIRDLKSVLMRLGPASAEFPEGEPARLHRAGSILRVLRMLLNWCVSQGWIASNPADRIKIVQPLARQIVLQPDEVARAAACAAALEFPALSLGFELGLWTMLREADLCGLTRMAWRAVDNIDPADAAVLANRKGDVMVFRVSQQKKLRHRHGKWVDCPVPPWLHSTIEDRFNLNANGLLLPDDRDPTRACPNHLFQRRARKALDAAGLEHAQFRDLRRSGMTMLADLGAGLAGITSISGHAVLGHKTILDTYMPGNTRAACAAMATAIRTRSTRVAREREGQG